MNLVTKQTALGAGAFLVVATAFVTAWMSLPHPIPHPARVLPATETIALFQGMTTETIAPFTHAFPLLSQVPVSATPSAVAILKTGSGITGWAMLEPQNGTQPFSIRTSDPALTALLQHVAHPLSTLYAYSALLPDPSDTVSAWLRFPAIALDRTSSLLSLVHIDHPAMIATTTDGLRVRLIPTHSLQLPPLGSGPKDIFAHPLFIVHASNGAALIQATADLLQPNPRLVAETVVRTAITSLFGSALSPAYDLPPLLQGTTTVQAALNTDQSLRIVLEGDLPDTATLNRLATLFRSTLATITQNKQTFDEKFHWEDIRQDSSLIDDVNTTQNGWNIRTIRQKETGKALFIATRGNRYILSNDSDGFQKSVIQEASPLSIVDNQAPAALGLMNATGVSDFLSHTMPTVWPAVQIPAGTGGFLKWKLTQEGTSVSVLFKKI